MPFSAPRMDNRAELATVIKNFPPDNKWKHARNRGTYLFNVKQLCPVFRARFVEQLRWDIKEKSVNGIVPCSLFDNDWAIFTKQPLGGPKQVIRYLGR